MKKIILLISAFFIVPAALFAKSEKRGICDNEFQYFEQLKALSPGVSWYYNWGNTIRGYLADQESLEYVPMCWNGNFSSEDIKAFCQSHPYVKYILGFNEPNFKAQANMTPAEAAEKWPEVQALAKELNLKIVAPALNYSPDYPYYQPTDWMDEFVSLVGLDAFDYTAIHNYGGFGVLVDLATKFHDKYGKPVWVTEFCYWPGEVGNVSPSSQIASMVESVEWLEQTDWIYRYSWFKAIGNSSSNSGPNYGLLLSGRGEEPRELSDQGKVYVYMTDFDSDKFHSVNTPVPATNYILRSKASLGSTNDSQMDHPIEISQFNAGAALDYQFDVPTSGEYNLVIRCSGMGKPTRFDPNIGIVAVNSDGSDGNVLCENRQFALTNDDTKYQNVIFPMTLSAGKQTIRLKDFDRYQPSGIRISTITLADAAGVNEIGAADCHKTVNVYNLQGVCVLKNVKPEEAVSQLSKGIYVIGGKKIVIK